MKKGMNEETMLQYAASYCSTAEHCIQDVKKKITAAGLPSEASERIITSLIKNHFIDERRYARSFVHDKFEFSKWGRCKINYELCAKNIPEDIRTEALSTLDDKRYREVLMELLKGKWRSIGGGRKSENKYKLMRYAEGRGYESSVAVPCVFELLKISSDDDLE